MALTTQIPRPGAGLVFCVSHRPDPWIAEMVRTRGHTVVLLPDGPDAVRQAIDEDADILIVAADLPADATLAVCRMVRDDGSGDRPIVVESTTTLPAAARLVLMEAGAWECVSQEDPRLPEQLLRIEACIRLRRTTARDRLGVLTDTATGLYNRQGLARRARELGAQIFRTHDPVACVVMSVELHPDSESAMASCARAVHDEGRLSDIVARLGERELAILAPRTDAAGVVRLAERMARVLRGHPAPLGTGGVQVELRASFDAVSSYGFAPVQPIDLVIRAAISLRAREPGDAGQWIRRSGGHSRPTEAAT